MYSIGEFSRIVSMPVKTIRYYHEQGLLVPARIDPGSGYRMFDEHNVETARAIKALRELRFSIRDIAMIIEKHDDDADVVTFLKSRREEILGELEQLSNAKQAIDSIIQSEERARQMAHESHYEVEMKDVPSMLVAGIRMQGKYSDCGKAFKQLGRTVGRYINGKAMMLCYDTEYKEDDADFEPCMAIRQPKKDIDGVSIRELPAGRYATLLHKGPYDSLGNSYAKLLKYLRDNGHEHQLPSREVYIKGPGMIFKGNPKKYLTEIQMRIDKL